jgi:hypothetical protein
MIPNGALMMNITLRRAIQLCLDKRGVVIITEQWVMCLMV